MGLEGAVRLGYRRELEAIEDPAEREAAFETIVADMYERGKALNAAATSSSTTSSTRPTPGAGSRRC